MIASQDLFESAGKSDEVCTSCNEVVLDTEKGLMCNCCNNWYHIDCQKVSEEIYLFLCSHDEERSLHWYCKTCTSILGNLLSTVSRIDQAQQRLES